MPARVLFIDRDGTLIEEPADQQVDAVDKVRLVPGVIPALIELAHYGYRFIIVSNQDGLGTDAFPEDRFQAAHDHAIALLSSQGIRFDDILICPHLPDADCECRKPRAGLLTRYLAGNDIDCVASAVIGDRPTDLELARRIGLRGFLLDPTGGYEKSWPGVVDALCHSERTGVAERVTNETRIHAAVNLDTTAPVSIRTGIGFYDHMLDQIARHGGFSLLLECNGDLEIDEHHTVEDSALCLGEALRKALGNKFGIGRYGFVLPMDESEAKVVLDLSGRARFLFEGEFPRERVGEFATEMVEHFFRSLSDALAAGLHIEVGGENAHHMVEACFKCVGRALRQAVRRDGSGMPSTKGMLA